MLRTLTGALARGGAVVTGAARGLGREIARALARRGYAVHVTDVDPEGAAAAAQELGEPAWASGLDVRDLDACREAARATVARAGSLAVWVNNAGILRTGLVWDHDDGERRAMLEVNAMGTINGSLAALELMRPLNRGHVINVVSLAGLVAAPGEAMYAASKHAALAFSLGVLLDLRRSGVREVHVSALCPDGVWTPMLYDKLEDVDAAVSFSGVMLDPETVAGHAVALLDHPRPVITVPRWRGAMLRFFDAWPRLGLAMLGVVLADARRRQRRFARRVAAGQAPTG